MSSAPAQFVGDIPRFYDRHLGPIIFQDYAADLARRAAAISAGDVLEIAAGTGISTVALRAALPAQTRLVVTDLNQPMLDIGKAKLPDAANTEFRLADAMALPFADASFDLAVIQFGVMFFPDKAAAFREVARVLRPGGALLFNVWGTMAANPFAEIGNALGARFLPANPPKFYQTPFGYHDGARVRADLTAGGFGAIGQESVRLDKMVADWAHFSQGVIYGNPMIAELQGAGVNPETVREAVVDELRARFGPSPATMPLEAIMFSARKA